VPSENTEHRKLAAIMFTDMVGYSALSQRNEKLAQELLEEHRALLRPLFARFNGTEIKTIGDAFLVEFHSALEAAQCGIEIQRALAKRNHDVPNDRRVEIKIGIHLGDVVHRGGDVYGDGVNIASRIEPLAGAGGICVSIDVERQIRNALEARLEKLGPTELKNIAAPMELFRIVLPWATEVPTGAAREKLGPRPIGRGLLAVAAVAVVAVTAAVWFLGRPGTPSIRPAREANTTVRPKAAGPGRIEWLMVLPLRNYAGDTNQDFFVDGMTDLLSGELSQISGLQVKSHQTSMRYKGSSKSVPEIGRELQVDAVVEGSVQRNGSRVLISVQLIETATDRHLWARKYERDVTDLLKMQAEITEAIATEIQARLSPQDRTRLANARAVNPAALELYLKARSSWAKRTKDGMEAAVDFCQRAVVIAPDYAAAHALLGDCFALLPMYSNASPQDSAAKARTALLKALELDPALGEAHISLGFLKLQSDLDMAGAELEFKQGLSLTPNSATGHQRYGLLFVTQGRFEEAWFHRKRAGELDPLSRIIKVELGDVFLFQRQYEEAIKVYRQVLTEDPDFARGHWMLGRALAEQGNYEAAIVELREACRLSDSSGYLLATLGRVYALAGRRAEAEEILRALQDTTRYPRTLASNIAVVHVGLGNKEEAFRWIERSFEEHYAPLLLKVDPQFDSLRSDPRFDVLLKRLGLEK
jgi:adenylate cyclase